MDRIIDSISYENAALPYSLEAEQAVLGAILLDPPSLNKVAMILKPEHFYLEHHKKIFSTIINLDAAKGGKFDVLLVLEALKAENVYTDEAGKTYLLQLSQSVPSAANVEAYAKIVKEKYYIRTLVKVSQEIIESASSGEESADVLLDNAEQRIYDIRQGRAVVGPSRFSEVVGLVYEKLYQLSSDEKHLYAGLATGFNELDRVITGLNKSDLILIGARPAMGKTSFALNLARNVAVKGNKKVVFFSLEMSKEQLAQRVLSMEARIRGNKMRMGNFTPKDWEQLASATAFLSNVELYFDDTSNITVPEMKARIRRLKDVDCVFIDYLQLMQSSKKTDNRVQEVSEITRSLKLMAKDLNIPVVTCAQLARATEARGKSHKPQLSDLRESGSIEQDADIVIMLYREDYYQKMEGKEAEVPEINKAELLIQKNRHGPTDTVELAWNPEYTLFTSIDRQRED